MTSFRANVYLLESRKEKNVTFRTHFPPKSKFWPIFDGTKFHVKKTLTMGMLTCKLLNHHRSHMKVV